jgi:nucleotide-binding universal stress UspA family protein
MQAHELAALATGRTAGDTPFARILIGIDETSESLVAAAQAAALRTDRTEIVLLAVAERYLAAHAGLAASRAGDDLVAGTESELARAKELVDADAATLATGRLVDVLRIECARRDASLIAVGVRPHRRLSALTFGGHDIEALHDAACSLLIARPGWGPSKPERIVVAIDGTHESRTAEAVARSTARRLGCDVVPVIGLGDEIDPAVLHAERHDALVDPGRLVDAVADASSRRSLVVVGRGHEGPRRDRSRAEQIVYSTRCSVLVVRHEPGRSA